MGCAGPDDNRLSGYVQTERRPAQPDTLKLSTLLGWTVEQVKNRVVLKEARGRNKRPRAQGDLMDEKIA